ncbi:MAG TPA: hypothetical protein V6C81_27110 [Planktothrix sp.]|jgi:hypothetical protein
MPDKMNETQIYYVRYRLKPLNGAREGRGEFLSACRKVEEYVRQMVAATVRLEKSGVLILSPDRNGLKRLKSTLEYGATDLYVFARNQHPRLVRNK